MIQKIRGMRIYQIFGTEESEYMFYEEDVYDQTVMFIDGRAKYLVGHFQETDMRLEGCWSVKVLDLDTIRGPHGRWGEYDADGWYIVDYVIEEDVIGDILWIVENNEMNLFNIDITETDEWK